MVNQGVSGHLPIGRTPSAPRPDALAGLVTIVSGTAGLLQILLEWTSRVGTVGVADPDGMTGWGMLQLLRGFAVASKAHAVAGYAVLGTAVIGGGLILLGQAMWAPINHRPLGFVGLALALAVLAGEVWWLARGGQFTGMSLGDLFAHAGPGWYLFLLAGPIGILGTVRAVAAG